MHEPGKELKLVYAVTVRWLDGRGSNLVSIFPNELAATWWLSKVTIVQAGDIWQVRVPSFVTYWPLTIARWTFPSKEEAEEFVSRLQIEEKRVYERWLQ